MAALYGLEIVGLVRRHEADLKVAELRMLWLALIVKKMNIIENKYTKTTADVEW